MGTFTVIDGGKVEEDDLGKNFFVTVDSVGKPKAQITMELLQELNPDVNGNYIAEVYLFFNIIVNSLQIMYSFSNFFYQRTQLHLLKKIPKYLINIH